MKKIFLSLILTTSTLVSSLQIPFVKAYAENNPITSAITSPITSPIIENLKPEEKPISQGSSSNSSTSSNSSNVGSSSCTGVKPNSAPKLYRMKIFKNTATLSWTLANAPVTGYSIEYGRKSNLLEYTTGAINGEKNLEYTIGGLEKNQIYYFKVRAFNGCMPGDYSNEMFVKISGNYIKSSTIYMPVSKPIVKKASNKTKSVKTTVIDAEVNENKNIFSKIVSLFGNR